MKEGVSPFSAGGMPGVGEAPAGAGEVCMLMGN